MANLSAKQELFVSHYLRCWNASESARLAGYSEKTAYSIGQENLKKPEIQQHIKERLSEVAMSADEVLTRLTQQARAEHSQFWKCDFGEKPFLDMKALLEAGYGHLIKSVTRDGKTGKITRIEFYDSQGALDKLAKARGLYSDEQKIAEAVGAELDAIVEKIREVCDPATAEKIIQALASDNS